MAPLISRAEADQRLDAQARLLHHDLDGPHVERVGHRHVQVLTGLAALDLDGEQQVFDTDLAREQLQRPRVRLGAVEPHDGPVERLAHRLEHGGFVDAASGDEELAEVAAHRVLLAQDAVELAAFERAGAYQNLAESQFVAHAGLLRWVR